MTVHGMQSPRNDNRDFVESVVATVFNKIPQPIRDFINDSQYTFAYAEKHRLSNWWIYKQIGRAFRTTGCAQWIFVWLWPWLCELREYYLDILAITQNPIAFVCGFGLGACLDPTSTQLNGPPKRTLVIRLSDYKSAVHVGGDDVTVVGGKIVGHPSRLDVTKRLVNFVMNCTVPILGIYLFPKIVNIISRNAVSSLSIVNFCMHTVVGITSTLALSISCFQGWFSALRCRNRLTQRDFSLTEEQKQQLDALLPMLPVHVKSTTIEKAISLLPVMYNGMAVGTHIKLLRGRSGLVVDCCLIGIGIVVWERASFRKLV